MLRCVCLSNLHPRCLGDLDRDMDSLYDALRDAKELIDSLTREMGTPELRELNRLRAERIEAALAGYRSVE